LSSTNRTKLTLLAEAGGAEITRFNALRHGVLSRYTVLLGGCQRIPDLDGAIKDYAEAIRLKPDFALAYYNRGLARRKKGDLADAKAAIADFQKYLDVGGGMCDGDQAEVEQFIRDLKKKP
jgi:tetratricopeptide (TPR) repeat protein